MTTLDAAAPASREDGGARTFVRRLYFYGMALISLIAALVAMDNLLDVLDQIWLGTGRGAVLTTADTFTREAIAGNGGVLLVATPIFLLHWGVILRRRDADELHSGMRKFFLYVAAAVAVGYAAYHAFVLLQGISQLAVGMPLVQSDIWPAGWLYHVLMMAATLALQLYFLHIAATDGDLGQERGVAGTWRRLYQTAAGLLGLSLALMGSVGLVETLLRELFERGGWVVNVFHWRPLLADYTAQLLLGLLFLRFNWIFWQRLATANPREAQTALRRFYLYAAVVISALTVLLPLAELVGTLLLVLFGAQQMRDVGVLDTLATTLAAVPIGLYAWRWHWRFLQQEAATYGESTHGATIRRLYYYAVALTGLVVTWFGAIDLVQATIDFVTGQAAIAGQGVWLEPLVTGLSRLLIAAPIWAFHWQVVQRTARREDATGQAERASGPRKVYLYGVALAGGLIILFYLAQVAYRFLLILLGDASASFVGAGPAGDLARSAIAAIIWTVHVMAIRRDGQLGADPVEEVPAPLALDEQRAILAARINLLEMQLREAQAELAALPTREPPPDASSMP